jgi:hypothetical protein
MYHDPINSYQLSKYRQAEDHARCRQAVMVRTALADSETGPSKPGRRVPKLRSWVTQVAAAPPKLRVRHTR